MYTTTKLNYLRKNISAKSSKDGFLDPNLTFKTKRLTQALRSGIRWAKSTITKGEKQLIVAFPEVE